MSSPYTLRAKQITVLVGVMIAILFAFNSVQRPVPTETDRQFDETLQTLTSALTTSAPLFELSPEISISLLGPSGAQFFISSKSTPILREHMLRVLQLIQTSGLLVQSFNNDYHLLVKVGEQEFSGNFSKEFLLKTAPRQTLSKLLSEYTKKSENNEDPSRSLSPTP